MRRMPVGGVVASVIALNLAGGTALAASKAPKPQDVAAARTVVRVYARFDETALRRVGAATAAAKALVARVQAGCAGQIPTSMIHGTARQQAVALDLVLEGAFDLSLDALHPLARATQTLAKGLDRAHFSQRAFTRRIHATGMRQREVLAIKPSNLCADVNAAAAGRFAADPPGTTTFIKRLDRPSGGPTESVSDIVKTLKPDLAARATGPRSSACRRWTPETRSSSATLWPSGVPGWRGC